MTRRLCEIEPEKDLNGRDVQHRMNARKMMEILVLVRLFKIDTDE